MIGDEGCIGPSGSKLLCLCQTPKIMQHMHGNIPYMCDCWPLILLFISLLLKSSMLVIYVPVYLLSVCVYANVCEQDEIYDSRGSTKLLFFCFCWEIGNSRPRLLYFRLFKTVNKICPTTGFELRISDPGSNRCTNWGTAIYCCLSIRVSILLSGMTSSSIVAEPRSIYIERCELFPVWFRLPTYL